MQVLLSGTVATSLWVLVPVFLMYRPESVVSGDVPSSKCPLQTCWGSPVPLSRAG